VVQPRLRDRKGLELHRRLIACGLVATAAAVLAFSALRSTEAAARSAQATPPCSEPALAPRTDSQARPSYPEGARQLAGRRIVVHYAAAGPNAPPGADRRPANRVPDYVEKIRNTADAALTFFAKPDFQGVPFQGFDTSFSDTAGPDQRLDIYIRGDERSLGRAVPPTRGVGGAFVVLSNRLTDRSPESKKRFKGDSLRFTVAHELFHTVQFNYMPAGMPLWVAEATANTLAFSFENVEHAFFQSLAFEWLKRPECAIWYEGFNCDRCYGGVWWWMLHRHIIRLYFEYLELHARDRFGVIRGIGSLVAATEGLAPATAGSFVVPYFYVDFAFNFAPGAAAVSYAHPKVRPPFKASIVAGPERGTKRLTLNPLAAHYVSIRVPSRFAGVEIATTGVDGPDPVQTLLVGASRTKGTTTPFTRQVAPCVTTFLPAYATFADTVTVNFRSERERKQSLLVIANRTTSVVHYTLSYQALTRAARSPSPNESWRTRRPGVLLPNQFCEKKPENVRGGDIADDAELGAPDLTEIDVSRTPARGNSRTYVSFVVGIPNRRELETDDLIFLWIDTDRNERTGCRPLGAELAFVIAGAPGPDGQGLARCPNGEFTPDGPGAFQARFDEKNRRLVFLATTSDLGGASSFNFLFDATWYDRASDEIRFDWAPDLGFYYCFPNCGGGRR
jgi:hypothetical protein